MMLETILFFYKKMIVKICYWFTEQNITIHHVYFVQWSSMVVSGRLVYWFTLTV